MSERPDFVVKGKEFENKFNIEQEILETFGGQLLFFGRNELKGDTRKNLTIWVFKHPKGKHTKIS